MHWSDGWQMVGGMGFWWILLLVVVVAVVVLVIRNSRTGGDSARESPEQVLKRRFASGEIDRDTYERTLSDLRR